MSGKTSRNKGRRGETAAKRLLQDRDYSILADTTSGLATDDLVAQDTQGAIWCVEVKYRKTIDPVRFAGQARFQIRQKRQLRWMVLAHIEGTSGWLVLRQAMPPAVWQEKEQGA